MTVESEESCDECGFASSLWTQQDAIETLSTAGHLGRVSADVTPELANTRPHPTMWSIAEYLDHMSNVIEMIARGAQVAVRSPGSRVEMPPESSVSSDVVEFELDVVLKRLMDAGVEASAVFRAIKGAEREAELHVGYDLWTPSTMLLHLCHDLTHHLMDIGRIRSRLEPDVEMSGSVGQVNSSGGGVPKLSVGSATVDRHGIVGDVQAARKHHGRPWQAVCLYSQEVIDSFRDDGHPIEAGSSGENITVVGLDWASIRPGLQVSIGDVRLRISAPAVPCSKNNRWFSDGDSTRMSHDLHPGWSRWYGDVLVGGKIADGDPVRVSSGG